MAKKSKSSGNFWNLNLISFFTIATVAVLYVISMVLSFLKVNLKIVGALQGVATAIMIATVAILAWRYVRNKHFVWKILYVLCLLLVIVGVIVPLVI